MLCFELIFKGILTICIKVIYLNFTAIIISVLNNGNIL